MKVALLPYQAVIRMTKIHPLYYRKIGTDTWFWSSTQKFSSPNQKDSYATHISKSSTEIKLGTSNDKYHGFPVRCLQD